MSKRLYNLNYGSFVSSREGYAGFRNSLRINLFTKLVDPKKKERILELGCNDASLTLNLAKYSDAYGIDINKNQIEKVNNKRVSYMSATDLKFKEKFFDKVCAFEIIEHIPKIKKTFQEVHRVLKPKGTFIFSFPLEIIKGQAALRDAITIYNNPSCAKDLHIHQLFPIKVKKIIRDLSFTTVKTMLVFIPFPSFVMTLQKR